MKKLNRYSKDRILFYNLFVSAFPKIERLPERKMMSYIKKSDVDLWNFYIDDEFVGFAYMMLSKKYAYLLFFATSEEKRGCGLGSKIVELLRDHYVDRSMVLDIEPLDPNSENAEQRQRRFNFYERLGFSMTAYEMTDETGDYSILATDVDNFDITSFMEMFNIFPEMFNGTEVVPAVTR